MDDDPLVSPASGANGRLIFFIDSRFPRHFIDLWAHIYNAIYAQMYPVLINLSTGSTTPSGRARRFLIDAHQEMGIFKGEISRIYDAILHSVDTVALSDFNDVQLTPREKYVLYLSMKGLSVHRIAEIYQCSEKAVYSHRNNIVKKFGFNNFNKLYGYLLRNKMLYSLIKSNKPYV
ncbi:helix-turn-helix transcriptional regulator [Paramixta manurensis]|uniref:helix-turn-helix transcriptional regulator n=1 Tax=Paramixta manurensis TaxID=2740817 RepID=UPI00156B7FAC